MENELIGSEPPEAESITFNDLTDGIVRMAKVYENNWRNENHQLRDMAVAHVGTLMREQIRRIGETK